MEPDAAWVPCDDFEVAQYWSMNKPGEFQLANSLYLSAIGSQ
jgi:hypothetical protein